MQDRGLSLSNLISSLLPKGHPCPEFGICVFFCFLFFFKGPIFFLCIYLFIWLHWVFVAAHGLFLVAASGG